MARVHSEFPLSGKHGNFIFYIRNGKTFMRMASESNDPKTDKQLINRAKMRAAGSFLKFFKDIIRIGYQAPEKHTTPMLEAQNYLMANSLIEVPPTGENKYQFDIQLSAFMVSRGKIESPVLTAIERMGSEIHLTWQNALGAVSNRHNDNLNIVAYTPGSKAVCYSSIGTRKTGAGNLTLTDNLNDKIHLWAFYTNQRHGMKPEQENVSDSVYLGVF